jgi:hypothetical protein
MNGRLLTYLLKKIRSIKFIEYNNGNDPELNPSKVHFFVNRSNLGFEDCDDVEATQTIELTTEDLKENGPPTQLKFVKYQRVKTLTIFIEDNNGGDVSALGGIKFYGRVRIDGGSIEASGSGAADFSQKCIHPYFVSSRLITSTWLTSKSNQSTR